MTFPDAEDLVRLEFCFYSNVSSKTYCVVPHATTKQDAKKRASEGKEPPVNNKNKSDLNEVGVEI